MSTGTITVTGATGTIGSELVRLLSEAGVPTRAVFRNPDRIHPRRSVAWTQSDLRDAGLLEPTLAGSTRLLLLSNNEPGFAQQQIATIEAAERLGVTHVVKLSALGASDHSRSRIGLEHFEVEQAVRRSAMTWTILRPHAFMQNWLGDVASTVRSEGAIYSPIGDGRVPFIDARDIAAVAMEALLYPAVHMRRTYVLTGGEAVGYEQVAAAIAEAAGRPVVYRPISMDEARRRMLADGVPEPTVAGALALAAYQKAGGPTAVVSPSVERTLGRAPRTIRDFATDYFVSMRPAFA